MSCVTLTFEVWIQVKVTAHRLNEDNICTKLVIKRIRNVTDGQNDEMHSYNPLPTLWRRIKNNCLQRLFTISIPFTK